MVDASVGRTVGRTRTWRSVLGGLACLCALWACAGEGGEQQRSGEASAAGAARRDGATQLNKAECDSIMRIANAQAGSAGQGAVAERDTGFQASVEWCERRMAAQREGEGRERRPGTESGPTADRSQGSAAQREAAARFAEQVAPARQELASVVPAGATLILVDQGTLPADFAAGRQSIPFLERDGVYWGPPADDETAIRELDRLRREREAGFIVFAWPAFWWLDHYTGFAAHLRNNFRPVLNNERLVAFDLTP